MIRVGALVRTNYGTGPYVVTSVSGPCTCAEYVRSINGDDSPSEPHWHLVVRDADAPAPARKRADRASRGDRDSYLNGYRLDGTSVWGNDRLTFLDSVQRRLL